MIGRFGPEGGILSCEDSDVILEIPQGAIPAEHQEQLIIARISLCPHSIGPKIRDPSALWLTPLVEMESPGLEKFTRDVKIRLPHRARLQPGWTFIVHFTDPTADTNDVSLSDPTPTTSSQDPEATAFLRGEDANAKSKWGWVEKRWHSGKADRHSRDSSRVNFKVDEKYINISTSHFSEYVCTGCNEKHPLNLEVVVYWKHFKVEGHQQMDLNVYIIDTIKDTRKANVEKNERASKCVGAQSGMTGYFPLKLEYKSGEPSWLAIQVDKESMGADWKWMLQTFQGLHPAQRVMSVESVIRCCCSPLLSAREMFSFHPKNLDNGEFLTFFQAMVRIKNTMPEADLVTPILVTAPLSKRPTQISKNNNNMPMSIEDIITDDHVEFISGLLPYDKWRPLYRKLMGKGAKNGIDHIVESNPHDPREQIHCALSGWKMSRGREATVEILLAALGSLGLQDVADDLQLFGAEEVTSNELPATSNAGPVFMESHL
ncbi:uncharacterized protein LOC110975011 isoform X1 [Acanthaster planci]|uniref:Uncharacterized protein LOC110975011 isoform X1 n=1 Tax=Acanthaster planci TaxID=133434 RepID=A0A8B7XRD5_ACAPL|nr:uncharacterized protein LOC110975011 isoform X1 [Acanthaster planci]XP_022082752.1 uncharacterized protein LOC110975011 isoform X1 [Acanthaster planci]